MTETNDIPDNSETPQDPTPTFVNPGPSLRKEDTLPDTPPTPPAAPFASQPYTGATQPSVPPYGHAPQPGYYPYPPQAPFEGLSIASLVLSIVTLYGLGSILGIIFGHVALHNIKKTGRRGYGLALAGTIVGYCTLALTILIAICLVVLSIFSIQHDQKYQANVQSYVRGEVGTVTQLISNGDTDGLTHEAGTIYEAQNVVLHVRFNADYTQYTITGTDPQDIPDYTYTYDSRSGKYSSGDTYNSQTGNNADNGFSDNGLNTVYVTN